MISEAFPTCIFGLHLCGLSHGLFTGGIGFRRNEEMIPLQDCLTKGATPCIKVSVEIYDFCRQ